VAGFARADDPSGYPLDAIGVSNRRSTVFLHDKGHVAPV
jgi:hypothetical protein